MKFETKTLQGGELTRGLLDEWGWVKNNGSYKKGVGFFSVHWEIQHKYPNMVRFHVESPAYGIDPDLNDIKSVIVTDVLKCEENKNILRSESYVYESGKKISNDSIQKYKSLEAFKVILNNDQI